MVSVALVFCWLNAKSFVANKIGIPDNKDFVQPEIIIKTEKDKSGKYGRWLAIVYYKNFDGEWINLNEELLSNGLAERYP